MEARLLSKAERELTLQQIRDFVVGCTQGLFELEIFFNGFCYEPGVGIYLVGPRTELEKVKNSNGIEDFDFEKYIKETDDRFWVMDWTTDINDPKLLEYTK